MTYKTNADISKISINTDVMVIGGGLTGVKSACELASSGYKVILIEKGHELGLKDSDDHQGLIKKVVSDSNIDIFTSTDIISSAGIPGDYSIWLSKENEIIDKKVGAVVVATDSFIKVLDKEYGLSLSDKVLSQSQIESILASDKEKIKGKNIRAKGFIEFNNDVKRKLQEIEFHISQVLQICNLNKNQRNSDFVCLSRDETDEIDELKSKIILNTNKLANDLGLSKQIIGSKRY